MKKRHDRKPLAAAPLVQGDHCREVRIERDLDLLIGKVFDRVAQKQGLGSARVKSPADELFQ